MLAAAQPGGRRVVVKFRPGVPLPYTEAAKDHLKEWTGSSWNDWAGRYPGIRFEPYFASVKLPVLHKFERTPPAFGAGPISLTSFFAIDNAANLDRAKLVRELKAGKGVETAYVESGLAPPPSFDPKNVDQKFQDLATRGIGSRQFSIDTGITGQGVGFVDIERGWNLDHEDLAAAMIPPPLWGENRDEKRHGTSVLGIVVATAGNAFGGKGIAPGAQASVVSILKPDVPDVAYIGPAILHAACAMSTGDVLLVEVQVVFPAGSGSLVPVEADPAIYQAIRAVTSLGIVVVEPAANGTIDLDSYRDPDRKMIFKKGHAEFRDSGAILVAAARKVDYGRDPSTNYGSRVDCFAWGNGIVTTDTDAAGTLNDAYEINFGQTSGAAAIVAGAAVLLQSWRKVNSVGPYAVATLRGLLSDPAVNTKSLDPVKDLIGAMPDLLAVVQTIETADVLAGSHAEIQKAVEELLALDRDRGSSARRDRLIGLIAAELAKHASRESVARKLSKAARRILREAGMRIRRERGRGIG